MEQRISLLGVGMDCLNVGQTMERIGSFLKNGQLNTVAVLTAESLLEAETDPAYRELLQQFALCLPGEQCILEAAGLSGGEISQELEGHELYNRMFWSLIRSGMRFLIAGETPEETAALRKYLQEEYTELCVVGEESGFSAEGASEDSVLNRINGLFPDVILSGLDSREPEAFLFRNRKKLGGRIWISFGKDPYLRQQAGWKESLLKKTHRNMTFRRLIAKYPGREL